MRRILDGLWSTGIQYITRLVVVICCTAVVSSVWAEGFRNPPPGGAGLGRSGVFIAHVDDATAITYNPAELSRLNGDSIMACVSLAETKVDYRSPMGSASSDSSLQYLPNVYASWRLDDDRAFGIGVTTPFGQSSKWDKDTVLRYSAPYSVEMQLLNINPTFSARLSENVYFGAGFDIYLSSLEFKQLADNGPLPGDGSFDLEAEGMGLGGNVGLSWDLSDAQRLAWTYRSSVRVDYDEGDARVRGIPLPIPAKDDFSSEINFPAIVGVGYGLTLSDTLRVELDVEWLEYSVNDTFPLEAPAYNSTVLPNEIVNDWDDSWTVGVGADWQFADGWTLYAGYAFLESPIPDETYSPSIPDADRHAFSMGLGFETETYAVDLAYTGSIYEDRDISGNLNPGLNGEYETESHLFEVAYSCKF